MANQARTKNKSRKPPLRPELEPISYEEIMANAGMSGFVSFLDEAKHVGEDQAQSDTVQAPITVQQSKPAPDTVHGSDTVQDGDTVQQSKTVQKPYTVQGNRQTKRSRITRARLTEEGHSLAEQQLYRILWEAAAPEESVGPALPPADFAGPGASRLVRIGYDRLATMARMSWLTVKNNLRNLERKLAIEVVAAEDSANRAGKQYRVFSVAAVLARREFAGLVWVRRTRGVDLLTERQADESRYPAGPVSSRN